MEEDKIFSAATIQIHSVGYTTPKPMKATGFSEDECSNLALRRRIQRQIQQILTHLNCLSQRELLCVLENPLPQ